MDVQVQDRRVLCGTRLVGEPIDRSQTSRASSTSEFGAGAPVLRFHSRRTVRIIRASTSSAITSWSSGKFS